MMKIMKVMSRQIVSAFLLPQSRCLPPKEIILFITMKVITKVNETINSIPNLLM